MRKLTFIANGFFGLAARIKHAPVDIPQNGPFSATNLSPSNTILIRQVVVGSTETRVKHEFFLLPFIAYSVRSSYVYLGVEPALFDTNSKLNDGNTYSDNGTFFIRNNQREIIQSVGLSINRMF